MKLQRCWHFWRRRVGFWTGHGWEMYGCRKCRIKWIHEKRKQRLGHE